MSAARTGRRPQHVERCAHCGSTVEVGARTAGATGGAVTGGVRGVWYAYCGQECRELHVVGVELWGEVCACGEPAVGDGIWCDEHLDGGATDGRGLPLAG